ncbi:hypothetical protein EJB05_45185, partial [Eragrostis curvula]
MANGRPCELAIDLSSNTAAPGQGNGCLEDDGDTRVDSTGEHGMVNGNNTEESIHGSGGHDSSITVDFEFLWRLRKYLMLLGILAVGVTYNAGLTPPGGFWENNKDGHEAGDPILRVQFFPRHQVFFYCNATAFASSLVLIILLLSKHVTRQKLWLRSMQFTMILDLLSLMGAYAAGSCRAVKSSIYIWVLVLAVFLYILIHILVSTRAIPKEWKENVQSMLDRILSKWGVHVDQWGRHREEDVEEARKFILMLVTFAASVTYQAGLSPPGGFWTESEQNKRAATSMLRSKHLPRYNFFVSCNSTSFVASLVTIILLLSPDLSKHGIRCRAVNVCVVADLLCLIGAYAAGSCRNAATSFYVVVIPVVVWICFAILTAFIIYKPVAVWLEKNTPCKCMDRIGRVFSLDFGSSRSRNTQEANPSANFRHSSGHVTNSLELESAFSPNIQESESQGEHEPSSIQGANTEEVLSSSEHTVVNEQQSEKADVVDNMENQSMDHKALAKEVISKTEILPVANVKKQSSWMDGIKTANTMPMVDLSKDAILARNADVPVKTREVEIVEDNSHTTIPSENSTIDKIEGAPGQDDCSEKSGGNPTDELVKKSRTYLLLLAILAASLTYGSGLNPPGGFWSRKENNHAPDHSIHKDTHHRPYHLPGDPILEDTHHRRYIAFFYLNAIAFVASLVMIIMLLNLKISKKVIKRYALQIAMIVDLLALTGSYIMGSCRQTKNSIYISLLLCLVLAYVAVHVLIAIHVIPKRWKEFVAKGLDNLWPELHQSGDTNGHNQKSDAKEKDWERRRNLLLMLAVLAATVTYQAGMNPPGGVWSDDPDVSGKPGDPILLDNNLKRYNVFYYSNSFSFVSSVVITILLVNKESCDDGIKSYALRVCLVVGLVGLLIAFSAGSFRTAKQSVYLIIIAIAVLISLLIQVLLLSSTHDTPEEPTCKLVEHLLELLVGKEEGGKGSTFKKQESSGRHNGDQKKHKYLMLLAILAASITYQAGLNPPGGTWSDDDIEGHVAGNPILLDIHPRRYRIFFWFNSISLMTSIVVIMFLLNKSVWKKNVPLGVLRIFMVLNLLALMTAFAAGSCRKIRTSVYVYALVVGVVVYLVIVIFLSVIFAKYLKPEKGCGISSPSHREDASGTEQLIPEQQV